MYNVILCAISLHGTKHLNREFEFATTKDLKFMEILMLPSVLSIQ